LGKSSDADREAEFQRQQEVLEARRKGKSLDKALARRAKLKKDMEDPVKRAAAWKKVEDSKYVPGGEYIEKGWVDADEEKKGGGGGLFGRIFGRK